MPGGLETTNADSGAGALMQECEVHRGGLEDLPFVRSSVETREFFLFPGRRLNTETMRMRFLEIYRLSEEEIAQGDKARIFVATSEGAPLGYCVLVPTVTESITNEVQSYLFDWGVIPTAERHSVMAALVSACRAEARSMGIPYLVSRASYWGGKERELLHSLGFWEDIFLVLKSTDTPPRARHEARRATSEDASFISDLNQETVENLIPKGREVDPEVVRKRYRYTYSQLEEWFRDDPHFFGFIAEMNGRPAGYILVKEKTIDELTGQEQGYVYDVAMKKESRGKFLHLALDDAAVRELQERGANLIAGEISASNRRALLASVRHCGYSIERCRMVTRTDS